MDAREKLLAEEEVLQLEERVKENGSWTPLVVTDVWSTPRSCMVKTESGNTLRRNRRQQMKQPEPSLSLESEEESTPSVTVTSERTIVEPPTAACFSLITPSPSLVSWDGIASHPEWPNCQSLLIGLIYEHLTFSFCASIDINSI